MLVKIRQISSSTSNYRQGIVQSEPIAAAGFVVGRGF